MAHRFRMALTRAGNDDSVIPLFFVKCTALSCGGVGRPMGGVSGQPKTVAKATTSPATTGKVFCPGCYE